MSSDLKAALNGLKGAIIDVLFALFFKKDLGIRNSARLNGIDNPFWPEKTNSSRIQRKIEGPDLMIESLKLCRVCRSYPCICHAPDCACPDCTRRRFPDLDF